MNQTNKNNGEITISEFKLQYKAVIIKTTWCWQTEKNIHKSMSARK